MKKVLNKSEFEAIYNYEYDAKTFIGHSTSRHTHTTKVAMNLHRAGRKINDFYAMAFKIDQFRVVIGKLPNMKDIAEKVAMRFTPLDALGDRKLVPLRECGNDTAWGYCMFFDDGQTAKLAFEFAQELVEEQLQKIEQECSDWEQEQMCVEHTINIVNNIRQNEAMKIFQTI